ncbi:MAG: FKBP-type peptidyl-prolyl cis-trans isomerase [Bacteroidales bacterium]|nr:FKBP-type peptidyl-prolyl cis-trans isomerase [Bacteroidales bacterium]
MRKISYALGMNIASQLKQSGVKELDSKAFAEGIDAILKGTAPEVPFNEVGPVLNKFFTELQEKQAQVQIEGGKAFLAANGERKEVVTLPSGLQYEIMTAGNGPKPKATDSVKCHYHGTLIDGTVFDSSVRRGEPAVFPVNGVIQGWVEALQLMPVGSKWKLFIPYNLGYGARGAGESIPPYATLIFEVELLSIEK